ncbi:LacI family transcriptional regulator [Clostridium lacusfryxellense]|nr:LacI family transcriptional regulator [Clostridium lacusfryxellense]
MKDVAKYTSLSIATISKYINGGNVLEENRSKIQEAIKILDYKVNVMARGLKTNKTMTIGILIPSFVNTFCMEIVSNIENILLKYGYSAFICDYREDVELEKVKLEFLIDKSVDGLILMPSGDDEDIIRKVNKNDIPIVIIDRAMKQMTCDTVLVDNMNASYDAVEQLITRGHRKIAIITGPQNIYTASERLKGYNRVHEDYSIPIDENLIKYGDYKMAGGYDLLKELLEMKSLPTAVFITNYEMTLGAIMAINEANIIIPDQLSIIGFDSLELTKIVKPSLSLVFQPLKEIGETAGEVIMKRIKGDFLSFPEMHRLKTKLIMGKSVKKIN